MLSVHKYKWKPELVNLACSVPLSVAKTKFSCALGLNVSKTSGTIPAASSSLINVGEALVLANAVVGAAEHWKHVNL